MSQSLEAIETPVGVVTGRDGFYLDEIHFEYSLREIRFTGEINGHLCSGNAGGRDWIGYTLSCTGVIDFRMTGIDFFEGYEPNPGHPVNSVEDPALYEMSNQSRFVRAVDSERLARMRELDPEGKLTPEHQHYIFLTYDHAFEIICSSYDMVIS